MPVNNDVQATRSITLVKYYLVPLELFVVRLPTQLHRLEVIQLLEDLNSLYDRDPLLHHV